LSFMCWAYRIIYVDVSFNKNIKLFKNYPMHYVENLSHHMGLQTSDLIIIMIQGDEEEDEVWRCGEPAWASKTSWRSNRSRVQVSLWVQEKSTLKWMPMSHPNFGCSTYVRKSYEDNLSNGSRLFSWSWLGSSKQVRVHRMSWCCRNLDFGPCIMYRTIRVLARSPRVYWNRWNKWVHIMSWCCRILAFGPCMVSRTIRVVPRGHCRFSHTL
jgi:hypothetical protein